MAMQVGPIPASLTFLFSADLGLTVSRVIVVAAMSLVTPAPQRAPFRCPPGLDVPARLLVHQCISIEDRTAKRVQVMQAFKRGSEYKDTVWLRNNKDKLMIVS